MKRQQIVVLNALLAGIIIGIFLSPIKRGISVRVDNRTNCDPKDKPNN